MKISSLRKILNEKDVKYIYKNKEESIQNKEMLVINIMPAYDLFCFEDSIDLVVHYKNEEQKLITRALEFKNFRSNDEYLYKM